MGSIAERHNYILEQLKQKGYVKVQELSKELQVSEVTIRKDLKYLETKKVLERNHGSASNLKSLIIDKHIDVKEKLQMEEKSRIAQAANGFIEPNDKIIIASGTTLLAFANAIHITDNITVITSSVRVSLSLCYNPFIEIVQLGGIIRKNSVSVIGHYAENTLNNLTCNKLFIGVDGIDLEYGLTTSDMNEAIINQKMIDVSQKVIVLTDSSKFGRRGFCKICDLHKVHHIITDTNVSAHTVEMIRDRGIEVTLV
ncbi:DeoR/GlpR transcriptional regulator [Parabacteroides sp. 52]|uniref:DeoR/GlpR family DNA-binding transcription regulator n=1 Tax=unclassified Parabacteroides TaxID=2649774 RepID=UPI0013D7A5AD|nr:MULTISPECIES: DeoR/GlpR family DNA-binding transcription regulator [unclassified Parabacteroides]MDH6534875.1 DeoR family transcriptional regulator of aga operon [Parabacteroides sp. PM5-20]NDV55592.1 DeoR/GlpR transcriptional regulator [Parabacteroides sp. 52]